MWKDRVFEALDAQHLFQDRGHRSRFWELIDVYSKAPFFTRGLCKCMFMSSWDDEHFLIMLDMLNQLSLAKGMKLADMNENGELMAEEEAGNYDEEVMKLSCAFIMDRPYNSDRLPADFDPQGRKIIETSLRAAAIIDSVESDL